MLYVFDIETNGLRDKFTKIHCVSYSSLRGLVFSLTDFEEIKHFFSSLTEEDVLVCHNLIRFDIPVLEKHLGIKIKAKLYDTLAFSWYLYPKLNKHGLENWGEYLGVKKPEIGDWENLTLDEYVYRCEEDVKINLLLYKKIDNHLKVLYGGSYKSIWNFLTFNMKTIDLAYENGWKVDTPLLDNNISFLTSEVTKKKLKLESILPKVPKYKEKKKPKIFFNKNGDLSKKGQSWINYCDLHNIDYDEPVIKYISGYEEPNASSHKQVKDFLFSKGWTPIEFKDSTKEGGGDPIPQVRKNGKLCISVRNLALKYPELEVLEDYYVIGHRASLLKGIKKLTKKGIVRADCSGFTNTLRLKHRGLVNLPGRKTPYGDKIRTILTHQNGILLGSDMSSLETRTKLHYMWDYDKPFVLEQMEDSFDPHLDLAIFGGAVTAQEVEDFKNA